MVGSLAWLIIVLEVVALSPLPAPGQDATREEGPSVEVLKAALVSPDDRRREEAARA